MPVRYSQLNELYHVMLRHLTRDQAAALLADLAKTSAYLTNASFRETVDRLTTGLQLGYPGPHNVGRRTAPKE